MGNSISNFLKNIGAGIIACFIALVIVATLNRYILGVPLDFSDEFVGLLFATSSFISIVTSDLDREHITVQILTSRLPPGLQRICRLASDVATILFFVIILVEGYKFAAFSWQISARSENAALPVAPWMFGIPVMALAMILLRAMRLLGRA